MQSAVILDAEVSSLLGHEAHGVVMAALGHLAHLGPLVCIRIIIQHFGQSGQSLCLPVLTTCDVG